MKIGKLSNEVLDDIVLKHLTPVRTDILIRSGVGEDCAAFEIGGQACVLTTDPITGSTVDLGKLGIHVSLNDLASSGAEPVGILMTLLCPETTEKQDIGALLSEASETAAAHGVEIIGGHTEVTSAVNRMVVSVTAVGKCPVTALLKTGGAQIGDRIYMTKTAATEGTAILAKMQAKALEPILGRRDLERAQQFMGRISVVPEGAIASTAGASAMHDATEGGILGAVYELCEASGLGCQLIQHRIPVDPLTEAICTHYHIDPLRLIASGSMIIAISPERAGVLERELKAAQIMYSNIGTITEGADRTLLLGDGRYEACSERIAPPEQDELYRVIG